MAAGPDLGRLLDDAERSRWPAGDDKAAWAALANWAYQTESLMFDEAENLAWEQQMRHLNHRELLYLEFTAERMAALRYRLRARKLAQANLRYKYGFRRARAGYLLRGAVRDFHARWLTS